MMTGINTCPAILCLYNGCRRAGVWTLLKYYLCVQVESVPHQGLSPTSGMFTRAPMSPGVLGNNDALARISVDLKKIIVEEKQKICFKNCPPVIFTPVVI